MSKLTMAFNETGTHTEANKAQKMDGWMDWKNISNSHFSQLFFSQLYNRENNLSCG